MEAHSNKVINGHRLAVIELDAGSKNIVIFCHGYRSSSIGPNRLFVDIARTLAKQGISSLRFDQYGSGNSEGDFIDSSFDDWLATTRALAQEYIKKSYRVVLFGQSMGGATVLTVAADFPELAGVVAWVPDPSVDAFLPPAGGLIEEAGQIVRAQYWQEAHDAGVASKLAEVKAPCYIVQASRDEYVSKENHAAIVSHAQTNHIVDMFKDYTHSSWSHVQAQIVVERSVNFIRLCFSEPEAATEAVSVLRYLSEHSIQPILYGSVGLALYLGDFKEFDDVDLLISPDWLDKRWPELVEIMQANEYQLIDEHEHEFQNSEGKKVAFAADTVLVRDGISKNIKEDVVIVPVKGMLVKTLSPTAFKRAYEFSAKDGYRAKQRGKKDAKVIALIDGYLRKQADQLGQVL